MADIRWINDISTKFIADDIKTAVTDDLVVTYTELLKLFDDIEESLKSTGTPLTQNEFNDLHLIANNLNRGGLLTSDYLVNITNNLVTPPITTYLPYGNPANQTWTGGEVSSIPLGNLAVGSTAEQLGHLIGKWFLGTDMPAWPKSLSSAPGSWQGPYCYSYSNFDNPLFGAFGPNGANGQPTRDINQGGANDCYFLATLAEVAYQHPDIITKMFTDNGTLADGTHTYGVRFYSLKGAAGYAISGVPIYVTVNNRFPDSMVADGTDLHGPYFMFNSGPNLWGSLAEKAYVQSFGNSWALIKDNGGGMPAEALEIITGASAIGEISTVIMYGHNNYSFFLGTSGFLLSDYAAPPTGLPTTIAALLADRDDVTVSLPSNASSLGLPLGLTLRNNHDYSVYGYDTLTRMLELRDPIGQLGEGPPQMNGFPEKGGTFEISMDDLLTIGGSFYFDNVGGAWAKVAAKTPDQTWGIGKAVNFALPANTFIDIVGLTLTYKATLANGSDLPQWLSFDPTTRTFTGMTPTTATNFSIMVTATDASGVGASETFGVAISALPQFPPVVATQTATQYWNQTVKFTLPANTFSDPDGQVLTYTAKLADGSALPSWLNFNPTTGTFSGTWSVGTIFGTPKPGCGMTPGFNIQVTATDTDGLTTSETFTAFGGLITTVPLQSQTWAIGQEINFTLPVHIYDPQAGGTIYYTVNTAQPSWLKFNNQTGTFTGTVPNTATDFSLGLIAWDSASGQGMYDSGFNVKIASPPPALVEHTATQYWTNQVVNFTLPADTFKAFQNPSLTYTATLSDGSVLPSWLHFNSTTGAFTGALPSRPSALDITVTATDTRGLTASETFSVYALQGATVTLGTSGNDTINFLGIPGNNIINGGGNTGSYANDAIYGGSGDNIFIDGPGNYIAGGTGNNIFDSGGTLYGRDGDDMFIIRSTTFAGTHITGYGGDDTVLFKDINPQDVTVSWREAPPQPYQ